MSSDVTIQVRRGVKVNVQEVDAFESDDARIPSNRDVHIVAPSHLKLAIQGTIEHPQLGPELILRCG